MIGFKPEHSHGHMTRCFSSPRTFELFERNEISPLESEQIYIYEAKGEAGQEGGRTKTGYGTTSTPRAKVTSAKKYDIQSKIFSIARSISQIQSDHVPEVHLVLRTQAQAPW